MEGLINNNKQNTLKTQEKQEETNEKIKAHQGSNNGILKQAKLLAKTSGDKEVLTLHIPDTDLWEPYGLDMVWIIILQNFGH